jgi:hypothetical protein
MENCKTGGKPLPLQGEILSILESEGVKKSVYVKWSGNGCHIHIHEEAISEAIISKAHPLDFAYAIVEYVNAKAVPKIIESLKTENIQGREPDGCWKSLHLPIKLAPPTRRCMRLPKTKPDGRLLARLDKTIKL